MELVVYIYVIGNSPNIDVCIVSLFSLSEYYFWFDKQHTKEKQKRFRTLKVISAGGK